MFIWLRTWQLGVKSLLLHPMRSLLTILGIFIGVASVIWLLAIGEGISRKAQEQIEKLGAENIIIRSVKPANPRTIARGYRPTPFYGITRDDMAWIRETVPTVASVMPVREMRKSFAYASVEAEGRLVGTTPEYAQRLRLQVDRGRFLNDVDMFQKETTCVLSEGITKKLFPYEDPIGKEIRIRGNSSSSSTGYPYTVVGVLRPKDATAGIGGSFASEDFSADVYVPIYTLWDRFGDILSTRRAGSYESEMVQLNQLTVRVDSLNNALATSDIIKTMLAKTHPNGDDFSVTVPLELLEQAKTTRMMFIVFMGMIAAISLVVGGIGIMNIMLATVTERTREIGIRRALGAKQGDIVRQFLVETIVLSVVGGGIGILFGLLCGPVTAFMMAQLNTVAPELMGKLPPVVKEIQPILVPSSIPIAFGIAVFIGVAFGLYPAIRAAAMDPIEALRHE